MHAVLSGMVGEGGDENRDSVWQRRVHDLPSTVTWQEHSAWPAPFLAIHLYKPLSSGRAFLMEREHSEPGKEEEELLSGAGMGTEPALARGARQVVLLTWAGVRSPVGINFLSPPKPGHFLLITWSKITDSLKIFPPATPPPFQ